nr:immunoglobulin light chain junction region [Macaca mulatta]MOV85929.1 immunoglobulin light chain junction region [Macaca mulatta]MOW40809.1 immunoglobulin light chain junction region [Macaca mulatta]
CQQYDSDLLTF